MTRTSVGHGSLLVLFWMVAGVVSMNETTE